MRKRDQRLLTDYLSVTIVGLAMALVGCMGPPALHRAVLGYDTVTSELEQRLLLLNIARKAEGRPVHFTVTSSIAATFDWTTTVGVGGRLEESGGTNFFDFNLGGSASENPTFSITPISGQDFTKNILTPFLDSVFEFSVVQYRKIGEMIRVMGERIRIQKLDGSFVRSIKNDPLRPKQYEEFRRIAMHLQWLNQNQQLFISSLVFVETLVSDFKGVPKADDINDGFSLGLRWRQKPNGNYKLTRLTTGRVAVTNYDPKTLSDDERWTLNDKIKKNPAHFVYLDIRPGHPGGEFPIQGAFELRSMISIIRFIAAGIGQTREFAVEKDPRTGPVEEGPAVTLQINVTDAKPAAGVLSVKYAGNYYSVADTPWDQSVFRSLNRLFQIAVGDVQNVGIPITISK
jgi:hypothetical protein